MKPEPKTAKSETKWVTTDTWRAKTTNAWSSSATAPHPNGGYLTVNVIGHETWQAAEKEALARALKGTTP